MGGGVPNNDVDEPELALTTPLLSQNLHLKGKVSETAPRFIDLVRCSVQGIKDYKCPKVVLGIRNRGDSMTISEETFACQEMVMDINQKFTDVLRLTDADYFKWNCVQIIKVTSLSHVTDEHLMGMVVNVSIGEAPVGSFSIRGSLVTSDGGISVNDAKEKTSQSRMQTMDNVALRAMPW